MIFDFGQCMVNEFEDEILWLGVDQVMVFIVEFVVGVIMGVVLFVEGYFKCICKICDKYGVFLIFDEVMCGMGWIGMLFVVDQEDISLDICIIVKGFGVGYQLIGVMFCLGNIYNVIKDGSGFFQYGYIYVGYLIVCVVGLVVV